MVGDKINLLDNSINSLGNQLEKLKTIKTDDDGWVCLTLECGIKICYFKGRYGQTEITSSEGSLWYGNFSKPLPANFFSYYPCVLTQCEVEGGYALQLILNVDASNQSKLVGWFYTSISRVLNPYLHLFCIGV